MTLFAPKEIIVGTPLVSKQQDGVLVSTTVRVGKRRHEITCRANVTHVSDNSNFLLAAALVPAMAQKFSLSFEAPISKELLERAPLIQNSYASWRSHLMPVPVRATPSTTAGAPHPNDVGCFFSGGVDSWYTLLRNIREVTKIVYIHGFDSFLPDTSLRQTIAASVRKISRELGKEFIEIETDIRDSFSDFYTTPRDNSGSLLISMALLLSPHFRKMYIASPAQLPLPEIDVETFPDPNWKNVALEIVHHGANVSRMEKVKAIADSGLVAETLRVCYTNIHSSYNCGRCGKCTRTMLDLCAVGRLEAFSVFAAPLSLDRVPRLFLTAPSRLAMEETLAFVREKGTDPDLAAALELSLRQKRPRSIRTLISKLFYRLNGAYWWIPLQTRIFGGQARRLKIRSVINSLLHR